MGSSEWIPWRADAQPVPGEIETNSDPDKTSKPPEYHFFGELAAPLYWIVGVAEN